MTDTRDLELALEDVRGELATLRGMLPNVDGYGRGDRDQQARAWSMIFEALVAAGLYSFVPDPLFVTGGERAVQFVRWLAQRSERLKAVQGSN